MKPYNELSIAICSDHAGYELKQAVINHLQAKGVKAIKDFGCPSTESCDYPDYAHPMATAVEQGEYEYGIAICGSGNGISMTANKHQGIRAALCWLPELAQLARQHNNANVLSMPARYISTELAMEIVDGFFQSDFEGGRHIRRVEKISL